VPQPDKWVPTFTEASHGVYFDGEGCQRDREGRKGHGGAGRVARVGWRKWVVGKQWKNEIGGDWSMERGRGGFPALNKQWEGVSKRGKEQEGASTHLCHWGPPQPSLHSSINKANGDIISDVSNVSAIVFAIQIGATVKLCMDSGGSSCGCNNSTTLTMLSLWTTLHIVFIVFIAVRLLHHRWF
jgi:hypothetical protein